mgnify:CR=1
MILRDLLQLVLFIGLLAALSPLLGRYVHQVFSGRRTFLHPVLGPVERGVYSLSGIHPDENQTWSRYAVSLIGFSLAGFLLTFGVLLFQDKLPELFEFGVAVSGSFVCHNNLLSFKVYCKIKQ